MDFLIFILGAPVLMVVAWWVVCKPHHRSAHEEERALNERMSQQLSRSTAAIHGLDVPTTITATA